MRTRQLNHSVYQIRYHLVWGTKYRYHILKPYVQEPLVKFWFDLVKTKYPTWYFHQINTGEDHVHILLEAPPKYAIAEIVQKLKSYASVYLRQHFKFIANIYPEGNVWSVGYFVSTVGLNEEQIKNYIKKQNHFDFGIDLTAEFS